MPARLRFGDVEIDVDAFELRRNGALHAVEPQVFELLTYLARNAGRLVTKDELIEAVWDGRIVSDATLASRIKSARRAIGDDGGQQKWIKTVHGRGVRFVGLVEAALSREPAVEDRPQLPSIAVLPFAAIGEQAEQGSIADGLTEDIITDLSRVSGLFVVARNSVFVYRGKPVAVPEVAKALDVRYVLEGSVRSAEGRVRISAQLIDGRTGGHLWAERYDRSLDDILALQDEISQNVVAALKVTLLPEELAAITRHPTANPEAYQYYLLGRSFFLRSGWGQRAMQVAREMFVKAAGIDPAYALAYAAIANCDSYLLCMGDPGVAFQDILANCGRALALQPDLADAHAAKGLALFTAGDSAEGSLALERAMKLGPDSFEAHFFAGRCYRSQGRFAEAAHAFERAAILQPDDFRALGLLTNVYRSLGREADARSAAQRCLERVKAELAVHRDDAKALAFGATILADFGELAQAEEWARRAEALDPDDLITNYNLACAWVALGRHELGIGRLERMFQVPAETTQLHLNWMKHDISLGPLHGHPRYEALVRHLEMPAQPVESKRAHP